MLVLGVNWDGATWTAWLSMWQLVTKNAAGSSPKSWRCWMDAWHSRAANEQKSEVIVWSQNQAVKHCSHQDVLEWSLACPSPTALPRNSPIHWQLVHIQTQLCPKGLIVWLNMAQHLEPPASQVWRVHSDELPGVTSKKIMIQWSTTTTFPIFLHYSFYSSKRIKKHFR